MATVDVAGNALIWDLADSTGSDRPSATFSTPYPPHNRALFSRDGRFLAVGQVHSNRPEQGVYVFDRSAGRRSLGVEVHSGESISGMAFDDQHKLFVTVFHGPAGISLRFHDLADPSATPRARSLGTTTIAASLSPDARVVGIQNQAGIELSEADTGRFLVRLAGASAQLVSTEGFSMDGRFIMGRSGNEIAAWETERGQAIGHAGTTGRCDVIGWSPNGRFLGWGEENGRLAVLELANGRILEIHPASSKQKLRGHGLSFSSDERLLAVTTEGAPGGPKLPEVWDLGRGRRIAKFPGRNDGGSAEFLPGRSDLLVTTPSGPRIWRLEPPAEPVALGGHSAEAWAATFSPDGKVLATGSDDTGERETIKLWDPESGRLLHGWRGHTATVATLAFNPDGGILASGSLDSGQPSNPNLVLWDSSSHARLAILPGHSGGVRAVAFSLDGRWLASAGDDATARLWDVATRTPRAILSGHSLRVTSLAFSPDCRWLATASCDATVRVWEVNSGQARAILNDVGNVHAIAFAPDGSRLASVSENGEVRFWDPRSGNLLRTIRGEDGMLRSLAFTPDGQAIAAAGKGQVIHLWNIATGQEILILEGHQATIDALAFSPNNSILASCGHDGAVRLWRASPTRSLTRP